VFISAIEQPRQPAHSRRITTNTGRGFRISVAVTLVVLNTDTVPQVRTDCEQLLALVYNNGTSERDAIVQERMGNNRNAGGKGVWNNLNSLYLKSNRKNVTDMQSKVCSLHSIIAIIKYVCACFQILHQLNMKS
jgi:hypothetical protein